MEWVQPAGMVSYKSMLLINVDINMGHDYVLFYLRYIS